MYTRMTICAMTYHDSRVPRAQRAVIVQGDNGRIVIGEADGIFGEDDLFAPSADDCSLKLLLKIAAGTPDGLGTWPSKETWRDAGENTALHGPLGMGKSMNSATISGGDNLVRPGGVVAERGHLLFANRCGSQHEHRTAPSTGNEYHSTREWFGEICHDNLLEWVGRKERR